MKRYQSVDAWVQHVESGPAWTGTIIPSDLLDASMLYLSKLGPIFGASVLSRPNLCSLILHLECSAVFGGGVLVLHDKVVDANDHPDGLGVEKVGLVGRNLGLILLVRQHVHKGLRVTGPVL